MTKKEVNNLLKKYYLVNSKMNYNDLLREALAALKEQEYRISWSIIYKVPRRTIMLNEEINEYKYYKIRNKMILCLQANLRREDFNDVLL